jgi:hypothetical protein
MELLQADFQCLHQYSKPYFKTVKKEVEGEDANGG